MAIMMIIKVGCINSILSKTFTFEILLQDMDINPMDTTMITKATVMNHTSRMDMDMTLTKVC